MKASHDTAVSDAGPRINRTVISIVVVRLNTRQIR